MGNQSPFMQDNANEPLEALDVVDDAAEPRLSFWQQPFVQNVLPLMTSLALHLGILMLGLLTYKAYTVSRIVSEEQVIVPDATIVEGDVGGVPNPGLEGDPTRAAASDLVPENTRSEGWNREPSKSLQAALMGGSGETTPDTVIGIGAAQSLGTGKGTGVGSGEGGASAPFGIPGGGSGAGPRSPFMGVSGNARTVAYVCDASGSMMGLPFTLVKVELKKAVDQLAPSQAFNICFFQENETLAFSKNSLVVANPKNKSLAYEWLEAVPFRNKTNPIPSLRLAFSQQPQLIYLLTDGAFDYNDEVIAEIRKMNAGKRTRINTIAFFTPDALASHRKMCEDVLRTIASENGGQFKVVFTTDLTK